MSKIFEFNDKIAQFKGTTFVSFESMMPGKKERGQPVEDPVSQAIKERDKIQQETAVMLEQARAEKEKIEEQAYQKGFAQGETEGRRSGEKEFTEKINMAVQLIKALQDQRDVVHRQHEEDLLSLIRVMVERLVGHEVSVNPLVIRNCLQKAMEFVVEDCSVKVHLSPDDFQHIKEVTLDDPFFLEGTRRVELLEDPSVSSGGCFLETDFGEIDARIENCRDNLFQQVDRAFMAALVGDEERGSR